MACVLVVDDEPACAQRMRALLEDMGHTAVVASSGAAAMQHLRGVDAVITDFDLPGMNGLQLLEKVHEHDDTLPTIIVTAHGSEQIAVRAMKAGACEYVAKSCEPGEISRLVSCALESRSRRPGSFEIHAADRPVVGGAPAMRQVLGSVARVAPEELNVLLRGERGTGKKFIASLIHAQSPRAAAPFVRFNCAAIASKLAEAELFGCIGGALAGAPSAHAGCFAQADGGTLLLEEVEALPLALQDDVLRVLQEGALAPIGAGRLQKVDVRVIASTRCDLASWGQNERFRRDLYYRLSMVEIVVPPLRERREDIPGLLDIFARRYRARFGAGESWLSPELVRALSAADWPGNLREMENIVARLFALARPGEIGPDALAALAPLASGPSIEAFAQAKPARVESADAVLLKKSMPLRQHLDEIERASIEQMLSLTDGNQSAAARRLGLSRSALIQRLKKYGLASSQ